MLNKTQGIVTDFIGLFMFLISMLFIFNIGYSVTTNENIADRVFSLPQFKDTIKYDIKNSNAKNHIDSEWQFCSEANNSDYTDGTYKGMYYIIDKSHTIYDRDITYLSTSFTVKDKHILFDEWYYEYDTLVSQYTDLDNTNNDIYIESNLCHFMPDLRAEFEARYRNGSSNSESVARQLNYIYDKIK